MRALIAVLLLFSTVPSFGQHLPVGKRTLTFVDASRSNRSIPTELYYPGASTGSNVPLATGSEKYPVVVFGHGFVMSPAAYVWLADSLVKTGFIVALPSTESGFSPSHEQFGRDLAFLAQRIISLNDSSTNFLFNRVAAKSAIGGHSMGGGCSFLAMTYNTQVHALFNFAAAETTPSAKAAASTIQKPTLIFSGSQDCIVAPSEQQTMYNNIPYSCKSYVNITGGLHCHFGNNDATCVFGQTTSGCNTSSINAGTLFNKTISLLRPFLQHYLKSDCAAASQFEANFNNITGATTLRNCSNDPLGCVVTAISTPDLKNVLRTYPNPASPHSWMNLELERGVFRETTVLDMAGRVIKKQNWPATPHARITLPTPGTYLLRTATSVGIFYKRIVFHNE